MRRFSGLLIAALFTVAPAFAEDDDAALEKQCKIMRKQAQDIALKKVAGTIADTDVEKVKNGECYWSIDIRPAQGAEKEVHVDGQSGAVLSVENDDD